MWMDPKTFWAPDSPQVWIWYFVWHGTVALRCTLVGVGQSQTFNFSKKKDLWQMRDCRMQSDASSLGPVNSPNCHWMSESRNLGLDFMYSNANVNRIRAGIWQIQQRASEQKTVFPPFIFTVFHVGFEARMVLITCKHWNLSHFWVGWVYRT